MKKIFTITSILALAACGGGSGGGSGGGAGVGDTTLPTEVGAWNAVSVEASNARVTGIKAFDNRAEILALLQERLGTDAVPDLETAEQKIENVYTVTFLGADNLKSMAAANENDTRATLYDAWKTLGGSEQDLAAYDNINDLIDYVTGHLPDDAEEIAELSPEAIPLDNVIFDSAESRTGDVMRWRFGLDNEGRISKLIYSVDSQIEPSENGEKSYARTGDATFDIDGKSATLDMMGRNIGLKYSDFGVIGKHEIVAGGYETFMWEPDDPSMPEEKMVFKGRAVGSLHDANEKNFSELMQGDSTLTFEKGDISLNMNFTESGWYDVTVKANDSELKSVSFDGTANSKYDKWAISKDENYDAWANVAFYGYDEPEETAGTFHYTDGTTGTNFNAGFGGTRQ